MSAAPRYAILIATRDRSEKIPALLRSIVAGDADDFEAVIVDQSADDRTEDACRMVADDPRFRYVRSAEQGLSRARNLAASLTSAPYLVIADDDCVVPPEWLPALTAPFERDPRVGVVFCTVVPLPFDVPGHTPHITFERDRVLTSPNEAWRAAARGLPLGAGMAIRRAAYDDVGGFDDMLGAGATFGSTEDSDLSWRAALRGWSTVHAATPTIVHDGFRDLDAFRALARRDLHGVGGALTKYVRSGPVRVRLGAAAFLAGWLLRLGLILPLGDVVRGRRPSGLRRPLLILGGVRDGLRTTVERPWLLFERSPHVPVADAAPPA